MSAYQKLVESSSPTQNRPFISYSQHTRQEVNKQIWFKEKQPLHIHMTSKESELFFFHDDKQVEVIEQMRHVSCMMQEELFYLLPDGKEVIKEEDNTFHIRGENTLVTFDPHTFHPKQTVRYFESEKACYNYNSQLFYGEGVKLWTYRLDGHALPESISNAVPLLQGVAQSVEFTLKGENLQFTASALKATFDHKKGSL